MWPSGGSAVLSRIACYIRSSLGWRQVALAPCVKQALLHCRREPACADLGFPTVHSELVNLLFLKILLIIPDWIEAGRAYTGMAFHHYWGWKRFKMCQIEYFDDPNLWILKCFVSVDESENAFLQALHRYGRSPLSSMELNLKSFELFDCVSLTCGFSCGWSLTSFGRSGDRKWGIGMAFGRCECERGLSGLQLARSFSCNRGIGMGVRLVIKNIFHCSAAIFENEKIMDCAWNFI